MLSQQDQEMWRNVPDPSFAGGSHFCGSGAGNETTLPSAVEAGLLKCTTLQKLTMRRSPPSVTAALLKAMTVIRSLEEVALLRCDYGM